MNEQKRRGRPPKTEQPSRLEETVAAFTDATGIVKPASTPLILAVMDGHALMSETGAVADAQWTEVSRAQAYALRVWSGQTDTIPRNERVRRVNAALAGQGFTDEQIEAVTLP